MLFQCRHFDLRGLQSFMVHRTVAKYNIKQKIKKKKVIDIIGND